MNGILFGLAPALRAASTATSDFASRGAASAKHDRVRASLVIAEVAITVMLVVIGGQLLGSFLSLLRTDPGFESNRVLASVILPEVERYPTPEQHARLYHRFLEAVRALPGVESAGTVDALPFSGENHGGFIGVTESSAIDPKDRMLAEVDVASADYLQTMGVRLAEGRWFHEEEMKESSEVALVDEIAARRLWPNASAIGKRIDVNGAWKEIIGVVATVRHMTLEGPAIPGVYLSAGALEHADFLVVRTNRPSADLENAIRRAIAGVDPDQPVLLSVEMRTLVADSIADRRFILTLLSVTAGLALLMSMAGVYGVMSYITSRRTQEIGIRMALGATPSNVRALIFGQGFVTVMTGLLAGLGSAWMLLRYLRGMLTGLESANAAEVWIAAALVWLAAAAACWVPARRATRIDPMSALRDE
jgi:predicted permease